MKIIVNNQQANSIIDTADANIDEVFDMFIGALIKEGFCFSTIRDEVERRYDEFQSLKGTHHEG